MAATKVPDLPLPTDAPITEKAWVLDVGETESQEWTGEKSEVLTKYEELKATAQAGGNISQLRYTNAMGRARCVATFGSSGGSVEGEEPEVALIEELYAIDIVRDVRAAPYFTTGGAGVLTDDEAIVVQRAVDHTYKESEITVATCGTAFAGWTAAQKQLRYHLIHGTDSYFETAFILRRTRIGVSTSVIQVIFTNINTVVTAPAKSTQAMNNLLGSLPSGEWLYKPPQAELLGKGKWRVTQEWHWATKWSKIYGGTWGL